MASTNHNTWTLIKHVAGSINKTAGKVDKVIYGPPEAPKTATNVAPKITQPIIIKPEKHMSVGDVFVGIGLVVMIVIVIVWIWKRLRNLARFKAMR